MFLYTYLFLCTGDEEEADTPEARRKFKKAKQKKNVVSLLFQDTLTLVDPYTSCAHLTPKAQLV